MSSHFTAAQAQSRETAWQRARKILFWRPRNVDEKLWARHAYFRAVCCIGLGVYFAYWHPEYSVISAWYHGSSEPIAHRGLPFDPFDNRMSHIETTLRRWMGAEKSKPFEDEAEPGSGVIRHERANNR